MPTLDDIVAGCAELIGGDDCRPVVVYAAIWPLARLLRRRDRQLPGDLADKLDAMVGPRRCLLMPTFTSGFQEGRCDLDAAPSRTGQLSEAFRRRPGVRRSVSAFFPFAVRGLEADAVVALRPEQAWGDGSLYQWFEQTDAQFLMLGTHPTHCSYLHRIEWLVGVPYRFPKRFSGTMRHEGRSFLHREELYVRTLDPLALNDFTVIAPALRDGGMACRSIGGLPICAMGARAMRAAFLPLLQADPLRVVQNRDAFASLVNPPARRIAG